MQNNNANNLISLILTLHNFCETTNNKKFNKEVFSIKHKILSFISIKDKVSPSVLVNELNIAKSNIALFCKKLIDQNLIYTQQDKVDHRVIYYCLTPQGEEYVQNFENLLNQHICQSLQENKVKNFEKSVSTLLEFLKNKE